MFVCVFEVPIHLLGLPTTYILCLDACRRFHVKWSPCTRRYLCTYTLIIIIDMPRTNRQQYLMHNDWNWLAKTQHKASANNKDEWETFQQVKLSVALTKKCKPKKKVQRQSSFYVAIVFSTRFFFFSLFCFFLFYYWCIALHMGFCDCITTAMSFFSRVRQTQQATITMRIQQVTEQPARAEALNCFSGMVACCIAFGRSKWVMARWQILNIYFGFIINCSNPRTLSG